MKAEENRDASYGLFIRRIHLGRRHWSCVSIRSRSPRRCWWYPESRKACAGRQISLPSTRPNALRKGSEVRWQSDPRQRQENLFLTPHGKVLATLLRKCCTQQRHSRGGRPGDHPKERHGLTFHEPREAIQSSAQRWKEPYKPANLTTDGLRVAPKRGPGGLPL